MIFVRCTLLSFMCALGIIDASMNVVVSSDYGDILGYQTDMARVFYGVPYAKPPVGNLRYGNAEHSSIMPSYSTDRWNPPEPIERWIPRVVNATEPAPACPQPPCNVSSAFCPKRVSRSSPVICIYPCSLFALTVLRRLLVLEYFHTTDSRLCIQLASASDDLHPGR